MLDVHPPHAPTHTWKDFVLHIATIVVGLLIAVGLEQTVEAIHHHHQVIRLQEDMRAEAEQNVRFMDSNFATDLPRLAWAISAMRTLRDAHATGGPVDVILPPLKHTSMTYSVSGGEISTAPSHSVWTIALATGQAELLPLNLAKVYDRLEREAAEYIRIDGLADVENQEYEATLRSLNVRFAPGETLRLASAQRDDLVRAVNRHLQMQYWDNVRLALWKGASEAVLNHAQTPEEIFSRFNQATLLIPKP